MSMVRKQSSTAVHGASVGKRAVLRQHSDAQRELVAKYAESFPNCIITNSKHCMEGGPCCEKYLEGEAALENEDKVVPDRFAVPCGKKCIMAMPFLAKDAYLYFRTSHLKVFYSDVVLVPLWWIAFTVVVSVSVDALTDPIAGTLADQLRSPCGRRRPLLVAGSLFVGVLFVLLWTPCAFGLCPTEEEMENIQCVDEGQTGAIQASWVYLMVVYLLFFISLDTFVISLEAFAAELTPSYSDRNCLFGLTMVNSVIGVILGVVVPPLLFSSTPQTQFIWTAVALSAYSIIVSCVAAGCLKERGMKSMTGAGDDAKKGKGKNAAKGDDDSSTGVELTTVGSKNGAAGDAEHKEAEAAEKSESEAGVAEETAGGVDPESLDKGIEFFDVVPEDMIDLDELADNTGLVPGFVSSMRNRAFRILLVSEILESLGDQLQFTIQPFVVKYVIMPTSIEWGLAYALLAVIVLVFELMSVPLWMFFTQKFGKWHTYVAWNLALTAGTALKLVAAPEEVRGLAPTMVAGAIWGVTLGGSRHIMRSLVADAIDYDELISGQRREGQYSIFIDFIPKLAEIPSTVVPLLVMAALGYVPNQVPQNDDVYWTILICFSLAPAFFTLVGALILFAYPEGARDPKWLDVIQDGIVLHATGKEAYDPVQDKIVAAPSTIQAAIGGSENEGLMQHFFMYEIADAVKQKSKNVFVLHSALWVVLYTLLTGAMVALCVYDWHTNIDPLLNASSALCETVTPAANCAGSNNLCTECADGFFGPDCSPCPGLQTNPDGSNSFVGVYCNGWPCNATGHCECDEGYGGNWCQINSENEPFAWFPVYIALMGIWVFFIAFHALRLATAVVLQGRDDITIDMIEAYGNIAFGRDLTEEEVAERRAVAAAKLGKDKDNDNDNDGAKVKADSAASEEAKTGPADDSVAAKESAESAEASADSDPTPTEPAAGEGSTDEPAGDADKASEEQAADSGSGD